MGITSAVLPLRSVPLLISALSLFAGTLSLAAAEPAESGAALFEAGRYEEAVRSFEEAVRRDPRAEGLRRNLAHARAAYGQELLFRGKSREAGELVDAALRSLPEERSFHLLRARIHFEDGRLYDALNHAESAVDPMSDSPLALELMGDIYYQQGELGRALQAWRQAAAAGHGRAEAKISRTVAERDAEALFGRDISVHFTLQYDGPVADRVSKLILAEMERLYDEIGSYIGTYPEGDIPVILYSRVLYHEITRSPLWAAGSFDGKIRVPVAGVAEEADVAALRPILAHELSHAFIRAAAPRGLPLWFEEGLAGHLEDLYGRRSSGLGAEGGGDFPGTLAALDRGLRGKGGNVASSYRAARGAVRSLIRHSGDWPLRRILDKVRGGRTFAEALQDATGLTPDALEVRLREGT